MTNWTLFLSAMLSVQYIVFAAFAVISLWCTEKIQFEHIDTIDHIGTILMKHDLLIEKKKRLITWVYNNRRGDGMSLLLHSERFSWGGLVLKDHFITLTCQHFNSGHMFLWEILMSRLCTLSFFLSSSHPNNSDILVLTKSNHDYVHPVLPGRYKGWRKPTVG